MEKRLISLPDPIRQMTIPEIFSVSQIVTADDCFLKVLKSTQRDALRRLLPNPSAKIGTVFHTLLESAVKGFFNGENLSLEALETMLDHILDETQRKLAKDPRTSIYADLTQTMTPLVWRRKRRSFIDTAFEITNSVRHVKKKIYRRRQGGFGFEDMKGDGRWVEVPICIPALRLKGKIDVLERKGDKIKIVDLKSGRIEETDGEIKPKIALQMILYGLMVNYLDPRPQVTLIVNDGTEHVVAFDPKILEEIKLRLHSTMSSQVPGAVVSVEKYTKVGPDCQWCDIRHRCVRYLEEAPNLWIREIDWRLPLDTWGTLEKVNRKRNGLFDLNLLDAGGRRIKIFSVREAHLAETAIGKRVWLFDLATTRTAFYSDSWRHPLNFHEIGEGNPIHRAWSLQVFVEKS